MGLKRGVAFIIPRLLTGKESAEIWRQTFTIYEKQGGPEVFLADNFIPVERGHTSIEVFDETGIAWVKAKWPEATRVEVIWDDRLTAEKWKARKEAALLKRAPK